MSWGQGIIRCPIGQVLWGSDELLNDWQVFIGSIGFIGVIGVIGVPWSKVNLWYVRSKKTVNKADFL